MRLLSLTTFLLAVLLSVQHCPLSSPLREVRAESIQITPGDPTIVRDGSFWGYSTGDTLVLHWDGQVAAPPEGQFIEPRGERLTLGRTVTWSDGVECRTLDTGKAHCTCVGHQETQP